MRWFVVAIVVSSALSFSAQNYQPLSPHIGLYIGYSIIDEPLRNHQRYHPWLVMFRLHWPISKNKRVSVYVEPQFNLANMQSGGPYTEWEGGLNAGLRYAIPVGGRSLLYGALGTGPHYLSAETGQQANGFIFSDNFTLGIVHEVAPMWQWEGALRFRHLSNAGLQSPNLGLDNWFLITGAAKKWK